VAGKIVPLSLEGPRRAVSAMADAATSGEDAACPTSFLDPVTFEIMRDPVLTVDGHTFERETIEKWLLDHDTSPFHGAILLSKTIVPNFALRKSIDDWRMSPACSPLCRCAVLTSPPRTRADDR
jgi:hypothetical protein